MHRVTQQGCMDLFLALWVSVDSTDHPCSRISILFPVAHPDPRLLFLSPENYILCSLFLPKRHPVRKQLSSLGLSFLSSCTPPPVQGSSLETRSHPSGNLGLEGLSALFAFLFFSSPKQIFFQSFYFSVLSLHGRKVFPLFYLKPPERVTVSWN